jgi:ANTAR domain-containing protein
MSGSDLADLFDIAAASQARSLNQLAAAAARSVVGCSAANAVRWLHDEPVLTASTHPDVAWLVQLQVSARAGPVLDARSGDKPVSCPDSLTEARWPEYAATALRLGIRSTLTLVYQAWPGAVTLTLAAARPYALDPRRAEPAEMLAAMGAAVLGAVSQYDDARRTASQLRDAAESRAVVDQAKGMLMHALSCSADEALERMRRASQRANVRAIDVARDVVASGGRLLGQRKQRRPSPGARHAAR